MRRSRTKRQARLGEARNPGDLVYLVGGRTGRDGIRGASFASKTLTDKSDTERSAVQVPDPFTKKLIIEAILEAVEARIVSGNERPRRGWPNLRTVRDRCEGWDRDRDRSGQDPEHASLTLQSSEIMISESQERMLLLIKVQDERRLVNILEKWELGYAKIGQVTRTALLTIGGERGCSESARQVRRRSPTRTQIIKAPSLS